MASKEHNKFWSVHVWENTPESVTRLSTILTLTMRMGSYRATLFTIAPSGAIGWIATERIQQCGYNPLFSSAVLRWWPLRRQLGFTPWMRIVIRNVELVFSFGVHCGLSFILISMEDDWAVERIVGKRSRALGLYRVSIYDSARQGIQDRSSPIPKTVTGNE